MARPRKKKKTHLGARNGQSNGVSANPASSHPKSMVIRIGAGEVGPSISQLVKDVRNMMEPGTASRLKERRSNRLRDYTAMAGPLGVSHLMLFSRSEKGNTNLRLALIPRGPTLHFRIEQYSLAKDVQKAQKHPQGAPKDFLTAPLLVMNNFNSPASIDGSHAKVPKHLESLTTTMFQSLFPPISPQATPLSSMRRVLLLNREVPRGGPSTSDGTYAVTLRHYAITTKRIGLSRGVRRLNTAERLIDHQSKQKKGMPNLGKLNDVADYLLDPSAAALGFTSASESEVETDAEVEVIDVNARKVLNKQQMEAKRAKDSSDPQPYKPGIEKRAVKMVELGPRLKMRMTKVEEGLCGGKVMWHEYVSKSPDEVKQMEKKWERRRLDKEERRRVQKENVQRKRDEKAQSYRSRKTSDENDKKDDDVDMSDEEEQDWDSNSLEGDHDLKMAGVNEVVAG